MKAILMSIQPKWCELIAAGKKTVEVRKTAPKEATFKAYIYQTKKRWIYKLLPWLKERQGKVIGEFIVFCEKRSKRGLWSHISDLISFCNNCGFGYYGDNILSNYIGKRDYFYSWHIYDIKIYDEPRELGEFRHWKKYDWWDYGHHTNKPDWELESLTHAPRGWQYVEELSNEK